MIHSWDNLIGILNFLLFLSVAFTETSNSMKATPHGDNFGLHQAWVLLVLYPKDIMYSTIQTYQQTLEVKQ